MPRYGSLYERLVANTHEPTNEQACWWWAGKLGRGGYGRLNLYVPGLGGIVTLQAHIALWVWLEAAPEGVDAFYLAYQEFICSGLELDHLCVVSCCIFIDHLEPVTPSENCKRRGKKH